MKIEIHAVPKFWIDLSPDHVAVLKKAAEWHYDGVCNQAAQVGGFIYGWNNIVTPYPGMEVTPKCDATSRQLDTCLKILEIAGTVVFPDQIDQERMCEMRRYFGSALRMANDVMSDIIFNVE